MPHGASSVEPTHWLQGDVGSGKTAVAFLALLAAAGSGMQGALMAPTEILASQHCERLQVCRLCRQSLPNLE